jgi:hypothetical protein
MGSQASRLIEIQETVHKAEKYPNAIGSVLKAKRVFVNEL